MTNDFSFDPCRPFPSLRRSGLVHADKIAIVDDGRRRPMLNCSTRAEKLAGALVGAGVAAGERVAVVAPNTQPMLEAHFGVPLAGAVLVSLNTRLTSAELAYIVEHSASRLLIYDYEFEPIVAEVVQRLGHTRIRTVRGRHARCRRRVRADCSRRRRAFATRSPTSAPCSR